jgi:lycopene cyclase domain-containing protein
MPEYALILLFLLLVAIFLHRLNKITIFGSKLFIFVYFSIALLFGTTWDHFAISRGHWSFGEKFLLGPIIGLMPIEEFAFFIVVAYFVLVVYKSLEKYLKN